MELFKRFITLESLKNKTNGLLYNTLIPNYIYFNIKLSQTMDDMGLVEDVPFIKEGDPCSDFIGGLNVNHINCYNPNLFPPNTPPPAIGSITAMVSGGFPPYTYEWSNGSDNETISGLLPGTYSVRVVDSNDCELIITDEIEVNTSSNPTIVANFSQNQFYRILSTMGGYQNVGSYYISSNIDIPISNLLTPYNITKVIVCDGNQITLSTQQQYVTYLWSNGSTQPTITVDQSGVYSVQTITSEGCEGTSSFEIEFISIPPPSVIINKTQKSGSGTQNNPYVYCTDQSPLTIALTNPLYYDSQQWMSGSNTTGILINASFYQTGVVIPVTVTVSSICCPQGLLECNSTYTGGNSNIQTTVYIVFTNDPAICFTEIFEDDNG